MDDLYKKIMSNYKEKLTEQIAVNPDSDQVKQIFGDYFSKQLTDGQVIEDIKPDRLGRVSDFSRRSKRKASSQTPSRSPDNV